MQITTYNNFFIIHTKISKQYCIILLSQKDYWMAQWLVLLAMWLEVPRNYPTRPTLFFAKKVLFTKVYCFL